jgi:aspartate carbamoyltransferase catalytic subunit
MTFSGRDFTDIHCLTNDEIFYILDNAERMKKALLARDVSAYRLGAEQDLIAALLFYENSTRTRTSFEIASMRLGLRTTGFPSAESTSVKKGESLRHTLDMYEAFNCDTVIMRHPLDGAARFAADHLRVPVFNAGDGKHEHPTQTLLDLFTIREHLGRLHDFDMGIAGDLKYGRTVHSLVVALAKFEGVRIHLFSHPDLSMPDGFMQILDEKGMDVKIHEDLGQMASEVDMVYQTRIQKERMPDLSEYERAKSISCFTMEILETTKDSFGLMHPLPIDKTSPSIVSKIDKHPKALYKNQAGNGVPTRLVEIALALGLLGDDFSGEAWQEPEVDEAFIEEQPIIRDQPKRTDVSIRPIRHNGVVIDHLAPYLEDVLVRILRVKERRDIYRAATVKSVSHPEHVKGMLMIEDREFNDEELRAIAAVSPGCTVNIVKESQVEKKVRLRLPARIYGLHQISCPNNGCITRAEHEESVAPIMMRVTRDSVRCYFCDQLMPSAGMF